MGVTRFPNGVGNRPETDLLGDYPRQDPAGVVTLFDDFLTFPVDRDAASPTPNGVLGNGWVQAGSTVGTPTNHVRAKGDELGGVILVAAGAGSAVADVRLQSANSPFNVEYGQELWLEARVANASNNVNSIMFAGLLEYGQDPTASVVKLGFQKQNGNNSWHADFRDDTSSIVNVTLSTINSQAMRLLQMHWDGVQYLSYAIDGAFIGKSDITDAVLPTGEMAATFYTEDFTTGTQRTMEVDYILVAQAIAR